MAILEKDNLKGQKTLLSLAKLSYLASDQFMNEIDHYEEVNERLVLLRVADQVNQTNKNITGINPNEIKLNDNATKEDFLMALFTICNSNRVVTKAWKEREIYNIWTEIINRGIISNKRITKWIDIINAHKNGQLNDSTLSNFVNNSMFYEVGSREGNITLLPKELFQNILENTQPPETHLLLSQLHRMLWEQYNQQTQI